MGAKRRQKYRWRARELVSDMGMRSSQVGCCGYAILGLDRVETALREGVATADAAHGHARASQHTVGGDGAERVDATRRVVAARRRQEWRQQAPVSPNKGQQHLGRYRREALEDRPQQRNLLMRPRHSSSTACFSTAPSALAALWRAMKTTSTPWGRVPLWCR